ncbi:hypothetical protein R4B61_07480 (plasmid) [Fructilactobacillus vespulae]|uniref:hypothetical protein n=1 Tax=Fructilactobacillus vespulae TaxID=1249630 RepID=UPI0039B65503
MVTNLMDKTKVKKEKRNKKRTIIDLMGYKKITSDNHHYLCLKDGTYCNLLKVPGIGLDSYPNSEYMDITDGFTSFLRQYVYDITFITTQFPASTQEQQIYWNQKLFKAQSDLQKTRDQKERTKLQIKIRYIKESLSVTRNVEQQLENQEYIVLIFAKNPRELNMKCQDIKQYGGKYIQFQDMDLKRKQQLLFKINNMNAPLNG